MGQICNQTPVRIGPYFPFRAVTGGKANGPAGHQRNGNAYRAATVPACDFLGSGEPSESRIPEGVFLCIDACLTGPRGRGSATRLRCLNCGRVKQGRVEQRPSILLGRLSMRWLKTTRRLEAAIQSTVLALSFQWIRLGTQRAILWSAAGDRWGQ